MNKSIQYLDYVIAHCGKTTNHLHYNNLTSIQFCCIGLIERFSTSALALKLLLEKIKGNPSLEYSCGIILRSSILDSLIVLNLYKILIENEASAKTEAEKKEIVKLFCDRILCDGLENTLKYMKTAKDVNLISEQELNSAFNNIVQYHQIFFEPYANDGSTPVVKHKYFTPVELFRNLAHSPDLKQLSHVYDSYLYFSKYDHFGRLYFEVSRAKHMHQLDRIRKGIELFVSAVSILHLALNMYSAKDPFLEKQSNIAAQYFNDNIIFPDAQN